MTKNEKLEKLIKDYEQCIDECHSEIEKIRQDFRKEREECYHKRVNRQKERIQEYEVLLEALEDKMLSSDADKPNKEPLPPFELDLNQNAHNSTEWFESDTNKNSKVTHP